MGLHALSRYITVKPFFKLQAIDISSDSALLATGSADKNVKIWGLDFGDCHKSIFAHDDAVTAVQFVPNTHMFFTSGKDGKIKQWDADNFERILTLEGHLNEVPQNFFNFKH